MVWVNAGSRWTSQTSLVTGHTGDTVTFNGLGLSDSHNTPVKGNPYYLFNVYGALDSENEWWYDETEQMLYLLSLIHISATANLQDPFPFMCFSRCCSRAVWCPPIS